MALASLSKGVVCPAIEFFINGMQTSSRCCSPFSPSLFLQGTYSLFISIQPIISSAFPSPAIPIPETGIGFLSTRIVHPRCAYRRSISTFRYPLGSPTSPVHLSLVKVAVGNKEKKKLMGNNW